MLIVIMLNVIMLSVIMLSVVEPWNWLCFEFKNNFRKLSRLGFNAHLLIKAKPIYFSYCIVSVRLGQGRLIRGKTEYS
jgi:hypothetical protein